MLWGTLCRLPGGRQAAPVDLQQAYLQMLFYDSRNNFSYFFNILYLGPCIFGYRAQANDGTFYEIPHSEMVGFWTVEFGGMNKAIHIWKFDNFVHRAEVRKALANDKEWQGKFLSPNQMINLTFHGLYCCILFPSGVYEMVTFQMKPGGPALWGQSFRAAINAHLNTGYTKLIGVFHTEYGLLNRVHVLWWNENPDSRAAGRHYAHEDARVVAAVRESVRFLESQQNMLLIPLPCSPLK
uniref:NIPSNAP domain-containing protein n=1 Tax=Gopherus evgoodei TaxID=1825980 RepID=A0A8C4VJB0_9SAUR